MAESARPKIRTSMQMSQASITALRQSCQQPLALSSPLSPRSVRHVHILPDVRGTSTHFETKASPVQHKVVSVLRPGKGGSSVKVPNSTCVATSLDFGDLALEGKYAAQRRRMSEQVGEVKRHQKDSVPSSTSPGQPAQPASPLFVPFFEPITAEELDESGSSDASKVLRDLAVSRKSTIRRTLPHSQASLPPISPSLRSSQPLFSEYVQTTAPVLTSTHDLLRRKGGKKRILRDLT